MATHAVFPTENNIGTYAGFPSRLLREVQFADAMKRVLGQLSTRIYSGLTLAAGTGLSVDVAEGIAIVNGYLVALSNGPETQSGLTASASNYIWISVTKASGLVTGFQLTKTVNTTNPPSADSVLLGRALTNATVVTSVDNSINVFSLPVVPVTYNGSGGNQREIFIGFQPRLVKIRGYVSASGAAWVVAQSGHAVGTAEVGWIDTGGGTPFLTSVLNSQRPELTTVGFLVSEARLNTVGVAYRAEVY